MSEKVECAFCGESITKTETPGLWTHPDDTIDGCPMDGLERKFWQWNMRPHNKEQPAAQEMSEVQWLRTMVAALTLEEPTQNYRVELGQTGYAHSETSVCQPKDAGEK